MRITNKAWQKRKPNDPIIAIYRLKETKYNTQKIAVKQYEHIWSLSGGFNYFILCRYSEHLYNYRTGQIIQTYPKR